MHVPQSASPAATPLSYVSAKLSQRGQSPLEWTHQHLPAPTATPWIQCVPLPHQAMPSSPIFAEPPPGMVQKPAGSFYYSTPGPFAPSISPIPLPRINHSSPISSSSSRHSHSSSHSSAHSRTYSSPSLHPLLSSLQISFPISTYHFSPGLIRVPQDFHQYDIGSNAFHPPQFCMQIQLSSDPAINPVVIQTVGNHLTVLFILQTLHAHLHGFIPREQFGAMKPATRATAQASFAERQVNRRAPVEGIRMLDVLAFGAKDVTLIGLQKLKGEDSNVWVPVWGSLPRHA